MAQETVSILEGGTFVVCQANGDIIPSTEEALGLFERDTRFLSDWRLTLDGEPLAALSTDDLLYFKAQFFLVPGRRDGLHELGRHHPSAASGGQRLPRGHHRPQFRREGG